MTRKKMTTKRRPTVRRPSVSTATRVPAWLRKEGTALVRQIRTRVDRDVRKALREGRKALKQVEARRGELQGRLHRDRLTLGRRLDVAVRDTLARLNIPNRREVADLTRKVDELSHKIDAFRARSLRQGARA
jgi:hypothetical protein